MDGSQGLKEGIDLDVDLGDLMRIAPGSGATMVLGTRGTEKNSYAVLAVCENNRFEYESPE